MILDPLFHGFVIFHIFANSVKHRVAKIVYHENKNVPFPCHCRLLFYTFLHPLFTPILTHLGYLDGYPWVVHFHLIFDPFGKGYQYLLMGRSNVFHTLLGGFGHFWVTWESPQKGC